MAVIVTGGAGYIGSHAVHALLDAGETPIVIDNLTKGQRFAVPKDVQFFRANAGDEGLVARIAEAHDVDAVMHFAGSIIVPESVVAPLDYYWNNTAVTVGLLRACAKAGIKNFVFSSTAAVYGTPGDRPVTEEADKRPESPYGTSKLMTETIIADAAKAHGINYAILRYFNVAGADPAGRTGQTAENATHLVKVACEAAVGMRDGMAIFGDDYPTRDGTAVRDYVHVSDLAEAHVLALIKLREGKGSIVANLGHGEGFTVREVVDAVKRVSGKEFSVRIEGRRPGDPAAIVANPTRARQELGWSPKHGDLDAMIRTALQWEKIRASGKVGT